MRESLRRHWPEYLMEAAGLGLFMVSACCFATLLEHPASPVRAALPDATLRRVLMGLAMGSTAIAIIYSPWGKQSGAHINPAVTLGFLRLGKVRGWDAAFYVAGHFTGALGGVALSAALLGGLLAHPAVSFAVTVPGEGGYVTAFAAEALISFVLMMTVLTVSNAAPQLARLTGIFAGSLVALYIAVEAPLSGMSMNPARTTGSAFPAQVWTAAWIYFTAPPLGMLAAAELHRRLVGRRTACAKLHHQNSRRCIHCGLGMPPLAPGEAR